MKTRQWLALAGLTCIGLASPLAQAQRAGSCDEGKEQIESSTDSGLPALRQSGSIRYMSGGIGAEESGAMRSVRSQYPLGLTLTEYGAGRSAFLTDVQLTLRRSDGTTVFCSAAAGPYVFIDLPPGQYRVDATTLDGRTQQRSLNLQPGKRQDLSFTWPASPEKYHPIVQSQPATIVLPPRPVAAPVRTVAPPPATQSMPASSELVPPPASSLAPTSQPVRPLASPSTATSAQSMPADTEMVPPPASSLPASQAPVAPNTLPELTQPQPVP